MSKISAYGPLAGSSLQPGDLLPVVDVSDLSMAASGTTKKITAGDLLSGAAAKPVLQTQALNSDGPVTIQAGTGIAEITLNANATSCTVSNLYAGQQLTISWIQGGAGGHTYVWPPGCLFAGGSTPANITAPGQVDTATFLYDGTNLVQTGAGSANIWAGNQYYGSGRPWFDVDAYGADPTGAADSTTAFNKCIAACLGGSYYTGLTYTAGSNAVGNLSAQAADLNKYINSSNFAAGYAQITGLTVSGGNYTGYTVSGPGTVATGIVATQNAFLTVSPQATASPVALGQMRMGAGAYKITSDLVIRSASGFYLTGQGPFATRLVASGAGFTQAVLFVDGAFDAVLRDFEVMGDGTEGTLNVPGTGVIDGIRIDWTTLAGRSTSGNRFENIRIRNLNFLTGFSLEGTSTRQVDGQFLANVVVAGAHPKGGQTAPQRANGTVCSSPSSNSPTVADSNAQLSDIGQMITSQGTAIFSLGSPTFITGLTGSPGAYTGYSLSQNTISSGSNLTFVIGGGIRTDTTGTCSIASTGTTVNNNQAQTCDLYQQISGPNIPPNTYITGVTPNISYTISQAATGTGSGLIFTIGGTRTDTGCSSNTATPTVVQDSNAVIFDLGRPISGPGIPAGAKINAVTPGVSYTISANVTSSLTGVSYVIGTNFWQAGFAHGNGSWGNIYDHYLVDCGTGACWTGWKINVCSVALFGSQPNGNGIDFWVVPGAQNTIQNVQSQNALQFLFTPGTPAPMPVSFRDVQVTIWSGGSQNVGSTTYYSIYNPAAVSISLNTANYNFDNVEIAYAQNTLTPALYIYIQTGYHGTYLFNTLIMPNPPASGIISGTTPVICHNYIDITGGGRTVYPFYVVNSAVALASGTAGAASASRWVGGVSGAAPTLAAPVAGDFAPDQAGAAWVYSGSAWQRLAGARRVVTVTPSGGAYTPNSSTTDIAVISTPATAFTIGAPTGVPADGQSLLIRFSNGATSGTVSWITTSGGYVTGAQFSLPTGFTPNATDVCGFQYDADLALWMLLAYSPGYHQ